MRKLECVFFFVVVVVVVFFQAFRSDFDVNLPNFLFVFQQILREIYFQKLEILKRKNTTKQKGKII